MICCLRVVCVCVCFMIFLLCLFACVSKRKICVRVLLFVCEWYDVYNFYVQFVCVCVCVFVCVVCALVRICFVLFLCLPHYAETKVNHEWSSMWGKSLHLTCTWCVCVCMCVCVCVCVCVCACQSGEIQDGETSSIYSTRWTVGPGSVSGCVLDPTLELCTDKNPIPTVKF